MDLVFLCSVGCFTVIHERKKMEDRWGGGSREHKEQAQNFNSVGECENVSVLETKCNTKNLKEMEMGSYPLKQQHFTVNLLRCSPREYFIALKIRKIGPVRRKQSDRNTSTEGKEKKQEKRNERP